jgi:hypothetical protein
MKRNESYIRARNKVDAKLGFYVHLLIFISVMALLIVINLMSSTSYYWFKWPLMGWGIGVGFHGLGAFLFSNGQGIRKRMIDDELHREVLDR